VLSAATQGIPAKGYDTLGLVPMAVKMWVSVPEIRGSIFMLTL